MLSGTQANIAIKLFGEDLNKMYSLGQEIKQAIADVDGIPDVMVEQQVERAQLQIIPRREMLARYGITLADFSQWISVALEGETVSQIYDGNATFDLTVKVGDGQPVREQRQVRRRPRASRRGDRRPARRHGKRR